MKNIVFKIIIVSSLLSSLISCFNKEKNKFRKSKIQNEKFFGYEKVFTDTTTEDFKSTLKSLNKILNKKQISKLDNFIFPEIKNHILDVSDSLKKTNFSFFKMNNKLMIVKRINDTTIGLSIGPDDLVLGPSGGYYIFKLENKRYKLFDIPPLE